MPEYTSVQKDYAQYRLDKSKEDLEAAHFPVEYKRQDIVSYRKKEEMRCRLL